MAVKAVLFDMDGTLADTMEAICSLTMKVMNELKLPAIRRSVIKDVVSKPEEVAFRELFPKHTHLMEKAREIYTRHCRESLPDAREVPGARDLLLGLQGSGIRTGIVTTRSRPFAEKLTERLGLPSDILVAFGDTRLTRPNPQPLLKAMEGLDASPQETLYIGDTPEDITQGRAAGVRTIAIPTGMYGAGELRKEGPDFMVRDLSEIHEIVRRINGGMPDG